MSITATGPIILALALYVFCFKPDRLAYYAVFFAPFSATAIVNFTSLGYKAGGLGLTPAMAFTLLLFASQLFHGRAYIATKISTGHLIQLGLIAAVAAFTVFSLLLNAANHPLFGIQVTHTTYFMIGLGTTSLMSLEFARNGGVDRMVRYARASAVFVSLWGLLQLVCSLARVPYPDFLFNNSQSDAADMFAQSAEGGLFARIASVAVEPSVLATSLLHYAAFGLTVVAHDARLRTRAWLIPVGLSLIVLLLSTSSTAYVGLATLGLLVLLERPRLATMFGAPMLIALTGLVAVFPTLQTSLLDATVNKSQSFSYIDRSARAAEDFAMFLKQPLFGFGWGSAANFGGVSTILCNEGLFGTSLIIVCGLYTLAALVLGARQAGAKDWRLVAYAAGARNAIVVAVVCAITSGIKYVFLDDWVFWGLAIAVACRLNLAQGSMSQQVVRPASLQASHPPAGAVAASVS